MATLQGQRFKTRKRDEKVKYDPTAFCDTVISNINEKEGNLEEISRYLEKASSSLDYRRYAEPLLDILIAGGMLAPGGKVKSSPVASTCVLSAESTEDAMRNHIQVFHNLMRRYKYLQKSFNEEMVKVLTYLKTFGDIPQAQDCLAIFTALGIVDNLISPGVLIKLFQEHLVKDELSLTFVTTVFTIWVKERGMPAVATGLRKSKLENRLLSFLPPTRRTKEHFDEHFKQAGLDDLVAFYQAQQVVNMRRTLKTDLDEMIAADGTHAEIIDLCQGYIDNSGLTDVDVTVMLWKCMMGSVEWNKKEDLLADQSFRHLKAHCSLFLPFCERGTPQLTLLIKMQEYCYDHMNFMKVFHKIVLLLYQDDVLTEQAILKWYNDAHVTKGKSVFLPQMKRMVDWLMTAEEESENEEPTPSSQAASGD